jgi:hypothetical protein
LSRPSPDQTSPRRLRRAARSFEQRVVLAGAGAARTAAADVKWPFERFVWGIQRRLIWPLDDCLTGLGWPARTVLAMLLLGGVTGGTLAASGAATQPGSSAAGTQVADRASAGAAAEQSPEAAPNSPELEGAAPSFDGAAAAVAPRANGEATASESHQAVAGTATGTAAAAQAAPVPVQINVATRKVPTAALRIARRFAEAFVLYEVGAAAPAVRRAFQQTAVPALTRALTERPPRQPAAGNAPRAKVLNVVAGPRYGRTASVSVALLRLGATSELRLQLQRTDAGWRVGEVRG